MKFSAIEKLVWALSFYGTAALLAVLLVRGRWRQFPVFTFWLGFLTARTILLYSLYRAGSAAWYAHIYWGGLWPDFALQVGVVVEIARIVLRPTGTWVRDARTHFIVAGVGAAVLAAVLACWVSPHARTPAGEWIMRGNLFTSLVTCELCVTVSLTASRFGLGWRSHVMALSQGLTAWSGVMVIDTTLQTFLGSDSPVYRQLDELRAWAYFGATLWMMVRLWVPEPERKPLAPEFESYILALHKRVEYDLRRFDAGS